MPTFLWGDWNDWFISIHSTKNWRPGIYYKPGRTAHIATVVKKMAGKMLVASLAKFDMISLRLGYLQVPFDWNNMSLYVMKCLLCGHQHDFLMSTTCQHNCMLMTALALIFNLPQGHGRPLYAKKCIEIERHQGTIKGHGGGNCLDCLPLIRALPLITITWGPDVRAI